jgi:signal transduction histidine kinase
LAGVEEHLREREPALLEEWLGDGVPDDRAAARLAPLAGLDWLEVVGADTTVLSSTPWPERAGLPSGPDAALVESNPAARIVEYPSGARPTWIARREVRVGRRGIALIGGRRFASADLERIAAGATAAIVGADRRVFDLVPDSAGRAVRDVLEGGATRFSSLLDADPERPGDWRLLVAVDRRGLAAEMERLRLHALAAVAGVTLIAALVGWWMARSLTRPVQELVRAVDAIAAGDADYTFTRRTEDAFEELVSAFSRLHRSLEFQQERSRAAERVAAWREAARRVAHEVKNPLAPIRLTVENLVRVRERAPEKFDRMFDEGMGTILEEVERLRRLVNEFSEFARLPRPQRSPTDLARLVEATVALYDAEPGVRVACVAPRDWPEIPLDADQVSRVLKNVIGNAVEAVRESGTGGAVEVRLERDEDWATVVVSDDGPGFAADDRERLFEPYFTTKSGGTGLGLAISHRIVTEHAGWITADNRPGGGGQVTIRLPLDAAEAPR